MRLFTVQFQGPLWIFRNGSNAMEQSFREWHMLNVLSVPLRKYSEEVFDILIPLCQISEKQSQCYFAQCNQKHHKDKNVIAVDVFNKSMLGRSKSKPLHHYRCTVPMFSQVIVYILILG